MKLGKDPKPSAIEPERKPTSKPKSAPVKYQGSRLSPLFLLALTILMSLFFYASGQH